MKTCAVNTCEDTNLVYSGIDAFMLGNIPTETVCYNHAEFYLEAMKRGEVDLISK